MFCCTPAWPCSRARPSWRCTLMSPANARENCFAIAVSPGTVCAFRPGSQPAAAMSSSTTPVALNRLVASVIPNISASKTEEGRRSQRAIRRPPMNSVSLFICPRRRSAEADLPGNHLGHYRQAILDLQARDLAVLQGSAAGNECLPCRMKRHQSYDLVAIRVCPFRFRRCHLSSHLLRYLYDVACTIWLCKNV